MFSDAITVFPRNLAAARFYFKAPFGAATIRGRLDFEGGVYRDRYARTYTASIIILRSCMHACAYGNCCRPLTMRRDFEGGVYHGTSWQINAATFRGRRDFEVRRDFEEIRYIMGRFYVRSKVSVYGRIKFR